MARIFMFQTNAFTRSFYSRHWFGGFCFRSFASLKSSNRKKAPIFELLMRNWSNGSVKSRFIFFLNDVDTQHFHYFLGGKTGTPMKTLECAAAISEKEKNPMVPKYLSETLQSYFHRMENLQRKGERSPKKISLESLLYRRLWMHTEQNKLMQSP